MKFSRLVTFWASAGLVILASSAEAMKTAMVLSDNCVVTQGRDAPQPTWLSNRIAKIAPPDSDKDEKDGLSTLGILLAREVIDFGVEKAQTYIKKRTEPQVSTFSSVVPTALFHLSPVKDEDKLSFYKVTLENKNVCMTVVANVKQLTHEGKKIRETKKDAEWDANWERTGPSSEVLKTRLKDAGFDWKSDSLSYVFEGRWQVSSDGTAVQFVPLFMKFLNFQDPNKPATAQTKPPRSMALSVAITRPASSGEKEEVVASQQIDLGSVSIHDGAPVIKGISSANGFGPELLDSLVPTRRWSALSLKLDDAVKRFQKFANSGANLEDVNQFAPGNVAFDATTTTEPSEIIKFLSDFSAQEDLPTKLGSAIKDELGLVTDDEIQTDRLAKLDSEIDALEQLEKLLKAIDEERRTDTQTAKLEEIPDTLFELKITKLALETGQDYTELSKQTDN